MRGTTPEVPVVARRAALLVAALAATAVLVLAVLVVRGWPPLLAADASIEVAVHAWAVNTPWAVEVSGWLEQIGRFGVSFWVTTAAVVVLLFRRRWRCALALALVAALAPLLADGLKMVVERARPEWQDPLGAEPTYSFPSGHATAGIAVYAACGAALGALLSNRTWGLVVAVAFGAVGVAIGISRVVLGVHWTSDVVAGWCVALAVAGVVYALLVARSPGAVEP